MHKKKYTKSHFYFTRILSLLFFIIGLEIIVFGGFGEKGSATHFGGIEKAIAFTPIIIGYIFGIISNEIREHLHK